MYYLTKTKSLQPANGTVENICEFHLRSIVWNKIRKRLRCKLVCVGTAGRSRFDFEVRFKDGFAKLTRKRWLADPARGEEIMVQTYFLPGGRQKLNSSFPTPVFQESALAAEPHRGLTKRPFQHLLVKIFYLCRRVSTSWSKDWCPAVPTAWAIRLPNRSSFSFFLFVFNSFAEYNCL